MSDKVKPLQIVIKDIREGICDGCDDPIIGYELKLESFAGLLCAECMQKKFIRRKEAREATEQRLPKETTVGPNEPGRKTA